MARNIWLTAVLEREQVETGLDYTALLNDLYVGFGFGPADKSGFYGLPF
jgi:hypothetical protein